MSKLAAAALFLSTLSASAIAAPYCLQVNGGAPMCMYVDGNQCQADAVRQDGACIPNPAEVKLPTSRMGEYCMVTPIGYTQCGFADGNTCAVQAIHEHGICTKSAGTLPQQVPDPYVPNAGR